MKKALVVITILTMAFAVAHTGYLASMRATEHYPEDTFLKSITNNKRALIITAHDDDAFACSGTFLGLIKNGWKVRQVAFLDRRPEKREFFKVVAEKAGFAGYDLLDIKYRTDLDSGKQQYQPLSYQRIAEVFCHDTVYNLVGRIIDSFAPEVIFTLDDSIGGYGHPDHIFMSRIVKEYCQQHADAPAFKVRRIYQSVFSPSMAESMIIKNSWVTYNLFDEARKLYGLKGMPVPDCEVSISGNASAKKTFMSGFGPKDQRNIRKFAPAYEYYPAWLYFRIFDREFFHIINIK